MFAYSVARANEKNQWRENSDIDKTTRKRLQAM